MRFHTQSYRRFHRRHEKSEFKNKGLGRGLAESSGVEVLVWWSGWFIGQGSVRPAAWTRTGHSQQTETLILNFA